MLHIWKPGSYHAHDLKSSFTNMNTERNMTLAFSFGGHLINLCIFCTHFVCYSKPCLMKLPMLFLMACQGVWVTKLFKVCNVLITDMCKIWQARNISQFHFLWSQKTSHTLPMRARHGMFMVSLKKRATPSLSLPSTCRKYRTIKNKLSL